jgi:hypothetical protein
MPIRGEIRGLIESSTDEIFAAAVKGGMTTMRQDGPPYAGGRHDARRGSPRHRRTHDLVRPLLGRHVLAVELHDPFGVVFAVRRE